MAFDYLTAVKDCATVNQFNRVHIDLENMLSPLEMAQIFSQNKAGVLPSAASPWLDRLKGLSPEIESAPEPYHRSELTDRIVFYQPAVGRIHERRLLIGFCGNADRLMLPAAVILQALPAAEWDVLRIIRHPSGKYLRPGTERADLDDLVGEIRQLAGPSRYRNVTCLGTSAGARVAALAALHLDIDRAVLMGGSIPDDWHPILSELIPRPREDHAEVERPKPDLVHAYPADHPRDPAGAKDMQAAFGGTLLAFAGIDNHCLLHALLLQKWFPGEFAKLLRADAVEDSAAGTGRRRWWRFWE